MFHLAIGYVENFSKQSFAPIRFLCKNVLDCSIPVAQHLRRAESRPESRLRKGNAQSLLPLIDLISGTTTSKNQNKSESAHDRETTDRTAYRHGRRTAHARARASARAARSVAHSASPLSTLLGSACSISSVLARDGVSASPFLSHTFTHTSRQAAAARDTPMGHEPSRDTPMGRAPSGLAGTRGTHNSVSNGQRQQPHEQPSASPALHMGAACTREQPCATTHLSRL